MKFFTRPVAAFLSRGTGGTQAGNMIELCDKNRNNFGAGRKL
jgi:hypothetical protein